MTRHPATCDLVAGRPTLLPPWVPPGSLAPGRAPPLATKLLSYAPTALTSAFVGFANGLVMRRLAAAGATVASVMTKSKPVSCG